MVIERYIIRLLETITLADRPGQEYGDDINTSNSVAETALLDRLGRYYVSVIIRTIYAISIKVLGGAMCDRG